jgi:hypothetical protein
MPTEKNKQTTTSPRLIRLPEVLQSRDNSPMLRETASSCDYLFAEIFTT